MSVEQAPLTGAIPTLWKYGLSLPNRTSPLSKMDLLLLTFSVFPQSVSAMEWRGMCSKPIYGV